MTLNRSFTLGARARGAGRRLRLRAGLLAVSGLLLLGLGVPPPAHAQHEPTQVIRSAVESWLKGR